MCVCVCVCICIYVCIMFFHKIHTQDKMSYLHAGDDHLLKELQLATERSTNRLKKVRYLVN